MTRARDMADLGPSAATLETTVANKAGKNLVINGAMQVAQRSTSTASVTGPGYHACDRWYIFGSSSFGTYTVSQSSTAPNGFANSLKLDCTVADASPSAGDHFGVQQKFEGQNLQQLKKGTSDAVSVTVSFWVRSSKTGTYTLELDDRDNTRSFSKTYTINAADTWEHKSVTFAGDTTGALDDDNANSFHLAWWLMAGSNFTSGTFNTGWGARTNANRISSSNVNLSDSTSNDWYLTGVQLEVGDKVTPFEHKSYADYEWDCQRYYHMVKEGSGTYMQFCTGRAWGTGGANGPYKFPRVMRASPTMTAGGAASDYDFGISAVPAAGSVTLNNDMMMINVSGSFTTGQIIVIGSNAGGSGPAALMFDAEL